MKVDVGRRVSCMKSVWQLGSHQDELLVLVKEFRLCGRKRSFLKGFKKRMDTLE